MAVLEVNNYIEKRYLRWHDYSKYHCCRAGMTEYSYDILNEVLTAVLQKEDSSLIRMLHSKKRMLASDDFYTELDYFVLRLIKLNIYSSTAPFLHKYKTVNSCDININRLPIQDVQEEADDKSARILSQFKIVRAVLERLDIPEREKNIFFHRFILGLPFSEWTGTERKNELYRIYNKVLKILKAVIKP